MLKDIKLLIILPLVILLTNTLLFPELLTSGVLILLLVLFPYTAQFILAIYTHKQKHSCKRMIAYYLTMALFAIASLPFTLFAAQSKDPFSSIAYALISLYLSPLIFIVFFVILLLLHLPHILLQQSSKSL
jgi:hypothetical protein